jgi:hypothetical protein
MNDQIDFEKLAKENRNSFVGEFWVFLKSNKKWWLLPILLILLGLGLLALLSSSAVAPFIYPLF